MRKSTLILVLGLLCVFGASALAETIKTVTFHGDGTDDPKVKIGFEVSGPTDPHHGGINVEDATVEDFDVKGATQTLTCSGQSVERPVGYFFKRPMEVNKAGVFRQEEKVAGAPDQTAQVKGVAKGDTAHGFFRLSGKEGPCTVETHRVEWKANDFG